MDMAPIREFVRGLLAAKGERGQVGDRGALVSSGLLDSVDVLEIVTFLEASYGVDFTRQAFDPDDFDTIAGIAAIVARAE